MVLNLSSTGKIPTNLSRVIISPIRVLLGLLVCFTYWYYPWNQAFIINIFKTGNPKLEVRLFENKAINNLCFSIFKKIRYSIAFYFGKVTIWKKFWYDDFYYTLGKMEFLHSHLGLCHEKQLIRPFSSLPL